LFKFVICIACRIIIYFQLFLLVYERMKKKQVHIFKEIVIDDMAK